MTLPPKSQLVRLAPLIGLITVQLICTGLFLSDAVGDLFPVDALGLGVPETLAELAASVGLVLGLMVEVAILVRLHRAQARLQKSLSLASGALAEVMEHHFTTWGLTAAERDVAGFTIKGFSITEIARLRGSAEGTIKTHLNAIYRKSGVSGRAQLISVLVEDLFHATPMPEGDRVAGPVARRA